VSKRRSHGLEQLLDGKIWQPLFLVEHARRLQSGEPESIETVLAWLEECGAELQSDLDSVRVFFPDETPAYDVASLRERIARSKDKAENLAAIGTEMLDLDAAIRLTDSRVEEYIPDDLFDSDASVDEMGEYALKMLDKKRRQRRSRG
jgi:hypothetical protein